MFYIQDLAIIVLFKIWFPQERKGSEGEGKVGLFGTAAKWFVRVSTESPSGEVPHADDVDPRRAGVRSHDAQL